MNHQPPIRSKPPEPFGSVNVRRRRRGRKDRTASRKNGAYNDYDDDYDDAVRKKNANNHSKSNKGRKGHQHQNNSKQSEANSYLYNYQTTLLILPTLYLLFNFNRGVYNKSNNNDNKILTMVSLYCSLIVYIMDLANWKEEYFYVSLFCFYGITIFLVWDYLFYYNSHTLQYNNGYIMMEMVDDYDNFDIRSLMTNNDGENGENGNEDGNENGVVLWEKLQFWSILILSSWELITKVMFFYCMRCWSALQCKWRPKKDLQYMERMLHFMLPISFSSITSFSIPHYATSAMINNNNNNNNNSYTSFPALDDFDRYRMVWSLVPILFTVCFGWSVKFLCDLKSSFSTLKPTLTTTAATAANTTTSSTRTIQHYYHTNATQRLDLENTPSEREKQKRLYEYEQRQMIFYEYFFTIPSNLGCTLSRIGFIVPVAIWFLSYPIKRNYHQLVHQIMLNSHPGGTSASSFTLDFILSITLPFLSHSIYLNYGLWWKDVLHKNYSKWKQRFKMIMEVIVFILVVEIMIHRYLISICVYLAQHVHYYHDDEHKQKIHSELFISCLLNGGIIVLAAYHHFWRRRKDSNSRLKDLHFMVVSTVASSICFGCALALPWYSMIYFILTITFLSLKLTTGKIQFGIISIFNAILTTSSLLLRLYDGFDDYSWAIHAFHAALLVITILHPSIRLLKMNQIGNQGPPSSFTFRTSFLVYSLAYFIMEVVLMREFEKIDAGIMIRFSSIVFIGFGLFLHNWDLINAEVVLISVSLSVAKFIMSIVKGNWHKSTNNGGKFHLLMHSIFTGLFLFCLGLPFLPSNPLRQKRNTFGKNRNLLGKRLSGIIALYCGLVLPALILHFMSTMIQMFEVWMGAESQALYAQHLIQVEVWGYSIWMWGTIVTLVLHHNLPEGVAKKWKLVAIAAFVLGLFTSCITPTLLLARDSKLSTLGLSVVLLSYLLIPKHIHHKQKKSSSLYDKRTAILLFAIIWILSHSFAGFRVSLYILSCEIFAVAMYYCRFVEEQEYSCILVGLFFSFILGKTINLSMNSLSLVCILCGMHCLALAIMGRFFRRRKSMETRLFTNTSLLLSWVALVLAVHMEFGIASIGIANEYSYILGYPVSIIITLLISLILILVEREPNSKPKSRSGNFWRHQHRHRYVFIAISVTQGLATLYILFIRGFIHYWINSRINDGYGDVFERTFGSESRTTHHFESSPSPLKYSFHDLSVQIASKLAASGFWTSSNYCGFIKHVVGFTIMTYSWFALVNCKKAAQVLNLAYKIVPLNLFPLFFCHGIQSLRISCFACILLTFIDSFIV